MRRILPRILALFLSLGLALPAGPAFALRNLEIKNNQAGLEGLETRLKEGQPSTIAAGAETVIPDARVFYSAGGPLQVRLDVGKHVFPNGLAEETVRRMLKAVSREDLSGVLESGRSLYLTLPKDAPWIVDGVPLDTFKLKLTTFRGGPPQTIAYDDTDNNIQQSRRRIIFHGGKAYSRPPLIYPAGGGYLEDAVNEYLMMLEAFQKKVPTGYPIGVGQFLGMEFQGKQMGFIVMAIRRTGDGDDVDARIGRTLRNWQESNESEIMGRPGLTHEEKMREVAKLYKQVIARATDSLGLATKTLRQIHEAGIIHSQPHAEQFRRLDAGSRELPAMYDFTTAISYRSLSREEFIFRLFNDYRSLYMTTMVGIFPGQLLSPEKYRRMLQVTGTQALPVEQFYKEYFSPAEIRDLEQEFLDQYSRKVSLQAASSYEPMYNFITQVWTPTRFERGVAWKDLAEAGDLAKMFQIYGGQLYDRLKAAGAEEYQSFIQGKYSPYRDLDTGKLAQIRDALEKLQTLKFSEEYPLPLRQLVREMVAYEMLIADYFPGPQDKIEFVSTTLSETGATDSFRVWKPRVSVHPDQLAPIVYDSAKTLEPSFPFRLFAAETRHTVQALWTNRTYRLTNHQQDLVNDGTFEPPPGWVVRPFYAAPFVLKILKETIEHLLENILMEEPGAYGSHEIPPDQLGFADLAGQIPFLHPFQNDAHAYAYVVDRVVRQLLERWGLSSQDRPRIARRLQQLFLFSDPERTQPIPQEILRAWSELIIPREFVNRKIQEWSEGNAAAFKDHWSYTQGALKDFHAILKKSGKVDASLQEAMDRVWAVGVVMKAPIPSGEFREYQELALKTIYDYLYGVSALLEQGSAFRAVLSELEGLETPRALYQILLVRIDAVLKHVHQVAPQDADARKLLEGVRDGLVEDLEAMAAGAEEGERSLQDIAALLKALNAIGLAPAQALEISGWSSLTGLPEGTSQPGGLITKTARGHKILFPRDRLVEAVRNESYLADLLLEVVQLDLAEQGVAPAEARRQAMDARASFLAKGPRDTEGLIQRVPGNAAYETYLIRGDLYSLVNNTVAIALMPPDSQIDPEGARHRFSKLLSFGEIFLRLPGVARLIQLYEKGNVILLKAPNIGVLTTLPEEAYTFLSWEGPQDILKFILWEERIHLASARLGAPFWEETADLLSSSDHPLVSRIRAEVVKGYAKISERELTPLDIAAEVLPRLLFARGKPDEFEASLNEVFPEPLRETMKRLRAETVPSEDEVAEVRLSAQRFRVTPGSEDHRRTRVERALRQVGLSPGDAAGVEEKADTFFKRFSVSQPGQLTSLRRELEAGLTHSDQKVRDAYTLNLITALRWAGLDRPAIESLELHRILTDRMRAEFSYLKASLPAMDQGQLSEWVWSNHQNLLLRTWLIVEDYLDAPEGTVLPWDHFSLKESPENVLKNMKVDFFVQMARAEVGTKVEVLGDHEESPGQGPLLSSGELRGIFEKAVQFRELQDVLAALQNFSVAVQVASTGQDPDPQLAPIRQAFSKAYTPQAMAEVFRTFLEHPGLEKYRRSNLAAVIPSGDISHPEFDKPELGQPMTMQGNLFMGSNQIKLKVKSSRLLTDHFVDYDLTWLLGAGPVLAKVTTQQDYKEKNLTARIEPIRPYDRAILWDIFRQAEKSPGGDAQNRLAIQAALNLFKRSYSVDGARIAPLGFRLFSGLAAGVEEQVKLEEPLAEGVRKFIRVLTWPGGDQDQLVALDQENKRVFRQYAQKAPFDLSGAASSLEALIQLDEANGFPTGQEMIRWLNSYVLLPRGAALVLRMDHPLGSEHILTLVPVAGYELFEPPIRGIAPVSVAYVTAPVLSEIMQGLNRPNGGGHSGTAFVKLERNVNQMKEFRYSGLQQVLDDVRWTRPEKVAATPLEVSQLADFNELKPGASLRAVLGHLQRAGNWPISEGRNMLTAARLLLHALLQDEYALPQYQKALGSTPLFSSDAGAIQSVLRNNPRNLSGDDLAVFWLKWRLELLGAQLSKFDKTGLRSMVQKIWDQEFSDSMVPLVRVLPAPDGEADALLARLAQEAAGAEERVSGSAIMERVGARAQANGPVEALKADLGMSGAAAAELLRNGQAIADVHGIPGRIMKAVKINLGELESADLSAAPLPIYIEPELISSGTVPGSVAHAMVSQAWPLKNWDEPAITRLAQQQGGKPRALVLVRHGTVAQFVEKFGITANTPMVLVAVKEKSMSEEMDPRAVLSYLRQIVQDAFLRPDWRTYYILEKVYTVDETNTAFFIAEQA